MAKKECAICKQKLGACKKKIPYANKVVCKSCAEKMECLVCKNKLRSTEAKVLFNDGFFCPECLKKTGITSFSNSKLYSSDYIKSFIDVRVPLVQSFIPTKKIDEYMSIDEQHKAFKIGGDIFEYKNLLSFELLQDNQYVIKGGLGRAILFGLIFGGIGFLFDLGITTALVGFLGGAITGGKKTVGICNFMKLRITLKNAHVDTIYIPFIKYETSMKNFLYQAAQEYSQSCISALEIIADYNRSQKEIAAVNVVNTGVSEADEILKFKKMMDDGIITNEEFEAKKNQILNLPDEEKEQADAILEVSEQIIKEFEKSEETQPEIEEDECYNEGEE